MLHVQNTIYLAFSSEDGVCIFKAPYAESNAYKGFNNANDNSPGYKKCINLLDSTMYETMPALSMLGYFDKVVAVSYVHTLNFGKNQLWPHDDFNFVAECGDSYSMFKFIPYGTINLVALTSYAKDSTTNYFVFEDRVKLNKKKLVIFKIHYDKDPADCAKMLTPARVNRYIE